MSSRDDILASIRRNAIEVFDRPDLTALTQSATTYADPVERFCQATEQVGGKAYVLAEGDEVDAMVRRLYPEAKRVASVVTDESIGSHRVRIGFPTFHPDSVDRAAALDGTDVAIVCGRLGVCENGAVWIEQDVEQRAVYFIAEALVILLDKRDLVNNMHEAYARIDTGDRGFGVFLSGPSKTADIEQALVYGAHGAASVSVLLL